jgi:hypothetical protein
LTVARVINPQKTKINLWRTTSSRRRRTLINLWRTSNRLHRTRQINQCRTRTAHLHPRTEMKTDHLRWQQMMNNLPQTQIHPPARALSHSIPSLTWSGSAMIPRNNITSFSTACRIHQISSVGTTFVPSLARPRDSKRTNTCTPPAVGRAPCLLNGGAPAIQGTNPPPVHGSKHPTATWMTGNGSSLSSIHPFEPHSPSINDRSIADLICDQFDMYKY